MGDLSDIYQKIFLYFLCLLVFKKVLVLAVLSLRLHYFQS